MCNSTFNEHKQTSEAVNKHAHMYDTIGNRFETLLDNKTAAAAFGERL